MRRGAPSSASGRRLATIPGAERALELTLAPIAVEAFLAEHWERRPLVVARGERGRFDAVLSSADVEWLICSARIRTPAFRLVKAGTQIPSREYTRDEPWGAGSFTEMADPQRVASEFVDGATIVLQALHLQWPAAAVFCRELEAALGVAVQANAYHTPAAAQGFPVHHDTHDVFVLQVEGRKRWLVYEPLLELPLRDQRWTQELGDPGEPVRDLTLEAGDTLYLPRGWPHEAITSDSESLHLTIGMHAHSWLDAAGAALADCAHDVELRRSIGAAGERGVEGLLARLDQALDPELVRARARGRFVAGRRPILHGQISQLRALAALTPDDALERRPTVIADLELAPEGVLLAFEGKQLAFPLRLRAEVQFVAAAATSFSARELPGRLDDAGRLVLVRRLVREGFLRYAETS